MIKFLYGKSEGLLGESIPTSSTPVNSLPPRLNDINVAQIRATFDSGSLKQDKVSFTYCNVVNVVIVYCKINFTLKDCFYEAVKLT